MGEGPGAASAERRLGPRGALGPALLTLRPRVPTRTILAHPAEEEVADLDHVSDLRDQELGSLGRLGQLGRRPHLQRHESVPL